MVSRRAGLRVVSFAVAALATTLSVRGANVQWTNTGAGDWADGNNWTLLYSTPVVVPAAGDTVYIDQGNPTISAPGAVALTTYVGYGGLGGGAGTAETLTINAGGSLATAQLRLGQLAGTIGTVVQNAGAVTVSGNFYIGVTGAGHYTLNGGTLTGVPTLAAGNPSAGGTLTQTGGTLNATQVNLYGLRGPALYEISGGTLNSTGVVNLEGTGTWRIKGSGATINLTGGIQTAGTTEFVFDNTANHITTVNGTGGTAFGFVGNLKASLAGGVLLSNSDHFTIFDTNGWSGLNYYSRLWTTKPTAATSLWNTTGDTRYDQDMVLTMANNKGALDANGTLAASFAPSAYGFVNLANINMSQPLDILVDVTGGTLSNFTNSLDAAGIAWTTATGSYDLKLTMDPSVSGGSFFAWDLGSVDAGMAVQAVAISVPEPTAAVFLGLASLMGLSMRRRSHAK